jgi:hypothetical protein
LAFTSTAQSNLILSSADVWSHSILPLVTAAGFRTLVLVSVGELQQIAIERRATARSKTAFSTNAPGPEARGWPWMIAVVSSSATRKADCQSY